MYGDNKIILVITLITILFCLIKKGYAKLIRQGKIVSIVLSCQIFIGVLLYVVFKDSIFTILILLALIFLSHIFIVDVNEYIIPYSSLSVITILGVINLFINDRTFTNVYDKIFSFIFFLILFIIIIIIQRKVKKEFIGGGDLMLFCVMALFLGSIVSFFGIFIASIIALIHQITSKNKQKLIPYGPYLVIGYLIALIICEKIV